ncbi:hypothetical protein [Nguyenibacter sp. L1]|uniref:hypothetical protein n=1 Tax=Nguyenibacter sp. L1 TaxID=3049350 RepID=UPI002B460D6B|nr:hypothetical protein [Nguyenibacter sp. L1]WRH89382.1 hypothetical protein QN315_07225 [Nguyenibacter sp. L1]
MVLMGKCVDAGRIDNEADAASAPDFDRVAFHHAFNAAVTAFFVDHLGSRR